MGLNATQIATAKRNNAKNLNIDERITKFKDQQNDEYVYRIPVKYFTDLGKINFRLKTDFRIKCLFEKEIRLFESKEVLAATSALPSLDAKIIFTKAPFIQYEQLLLDKNFRRYLETIMVSKKVLRMGAQKTLIQKTYEINTGQDSLNIDFLGANRQLDWIEIFIVDDKNERHTSIYDSYNVKLAAKTIKSVKLSNFTKVYSLTNETKFDVDNLTQKYLLYKQFVAWSCN